MRYAPSLVPWIALVFAACTDEAASFKITETTKATFPALPDNVELPETLPDTLPQTLPQTLPTATTVIGTATVPFGTETLEAAEEAGFDPADFDPDKYLDLDLGPEQIAQLGIGPDDVSRVILRDVRIEVLSPDEGDLTFIDALELWVSADGLDDLQLVDQEGFEAGAQDVHLAVVPANLEPYLFGENLDLTPLLDGLPPPADTSVRFTLELEVGVTYNGLLNRF